MTGAIIGITVAYVALAVLLLNLNFHSRWPAWIKGAAVAVVTVFYFVTYWALQGLLGWPTGDGTPREFIVLSAHVEEPDDKLGVKGGVYLWILAREDSRVGDTPRAYRLPYSKELHAQASRAAKQINRGIAQIGKMETAAPSASGVLAPWIEDRPQNLIIYDLPAPELPDK